MGGAPICEASIGDAICEFVGSPSQTQAVVRLPAVDKEGPVAVKVRAQNWNGASSDAAFTYFMPEVFGAIGERIELSDEGGTATRVEDVTGGICAGKFPLRRLPEGRYFEIILQEKISSMRCIAVGITVARSAEDLSEVNQRFHRSEARELQRVWLAGYDKAGSL